MAVDVVLGLQRGDEGKGRVVDFLCMDSEYTVVAKFNGGPNAGHRISLGGIALTLHQVPSGVRNPDTLNIIGNGTLVDVNRLADELEDIRGAGLAVSPKNLAISYASHLIFPHHIALDELREHGLEAQGSTKRGIAYAAADKYQRSGMRAESLSDPAALEAHIRHNLLGANEQLVASGMEPYDIDAETNRFLQSARIFLPYIADTASLLHNRLARHEDVLAEGAQAASLDIEQAPYPYGSSSHTTTGGVLTGLSIGPQHIRDVFGVAKFVQSHVGDGPFPTEILDPELAAQLRGERGLIDSEFGGSTQRPRRVGRPNLADLRRAIQVNGVTALILNKLDCVPKFGSLFEIGTSYILDGQPLDTSPGSVGLLSRCNPVYQTFPTWGGDISGLRRYDDLPRNARTIVEFIETELGVPISMLGVGPHQDQVILRS